MDKKEARTLLDGVVAEYEAKPYSHWATLMHDAASGKDVDSFDEGGDSPSKWIEVKGESGVTYQVQIQFFWDSEEGGAIRIIFSIDDGGMRAYFPLTEDLLLSKET